jgi:Flp pilus assembly protein TadG
MRSIGNQRGQSLLEFALIAPFVLFFLLALVDFGIAIDRRIVLDHAVREGARYAAVGGQALTSGTPATEAQIKSYTSAQAQGISNNVTVCYDDSNADGVWGDLGDNVSVGINYTYDFVTGFTDLLDSSIGSIVMNPSANARVEQAAPSGATHCL